MGGLNIKHFRSAGLIRFAVVSIMLSCMLVVRYMNLDKGNHNFHRHLSGDKTGTETVIDNRAMKIPRQLLFEANHGQTSNDVQFISRGQGTSMFFGPTGMDFVIYKAAQSQVHDHHGEEDFTPRERLKFRSASFSMQFVNANRSMVLEGRDETMCKSNYLHTNDRSQWRTDIPNYRKIGGRDLYPGIDLVYYGNNGELEFDFVVQPGADPNQIQIQVDGDNCISMNDDGSIVIVLADERVILRKPYIYQDIDGQRVTVQGEYQRTKENLIQFKVDEYAADYPLVIDPVVAYATYFGGGSEWIKDMEVDDLGNIYILGGTRDPFAPSPNNVGDEKAYYFIAKIHPDEGWRYFTLFGVESTTGEGLAVDALGNAYATGYTGYKDFPTVNAYQDESGGGSGDGFLFKLNAAGNAILYATYYGGGDHEGDYGNAADVAVDASQHAVIVGTTIPAIGGDPFPIKNAFQDELMYYGFTGYAARFNTTGSGESSLIYSTYLAGEGDTEAGAVAVDAAGNAFVTGVTRGDNFPTVNAAQATRRGKRDAFVVKLAAAGNTAFYSTYLGGDGDNGDRGYDIEIDAEGNAYVAGAQSNENFPTTPGAFFTGPGGTFLTKFGPGGNIVYSTLNPLRHYALAVDELGYAYTGGSRWVQMPDGTRQSDASFAVFNQAGSDTLYTFAVGGSGHDYTAYIDVDQDGIIYMTGNTYSTDFPVVNPLQANHGGGDWDNHITKVLPKDNIQIGPMYPHPQDRDIFYWEPAVMRPGQKWEFDVDLIYTMISAPEGKIEMKIVSNKGEVFDEKVIEPIQEGIKETITSVISDEITIPHTEDIDTLFLKFYLIPENEPEPVDSAIVHYRYFVYDWTFLIYMDGDCDLEPAALRDMQELMNVNANDSVAVFVLLDRHPKYTKDWGNWTSTRLYSIKPNEYGNYIYKDAGELDMGDPNTLYWFIKQGLKEFPAMHYVLDLWDHGDGWMEKRIGKVNNLFPKLPPQEGEDDLFKVAGIDETNKNALLSPEIRLVLNNSPYFDIVGVDACLNAMVENVYQFRNGGGYFVASEDVVPNQGWPYHMILEKVKENPQMAPIVLADLIVAEYGASYNLTQPNVTHSATDFAQAGLLKEAVNNLATALIEKKPWDEVTTAVAQAKNYANKPYRDLYHFSQLLRGIASDNEVYQACTGMMNAISSAVTANYHSLVYEENSHGLTIYFPRFKELYCEKYHAPNRVDLSDDTQWDEFLRLYLWRTTPPNTDTTGVETAIYDTYEVNDTMTQSFGPLVPETSYHSYIPHPDDKDFYFIAPGKTTSLYATLTVPGGVNYDLIVYDSNGNEVGSSRSASSPEIVTLSNLPSGTYYIEVANNGDFVKVPYKLSVDYEGYQMGSVRLSSDDGDPDSSIYSTDATDVIGVTMNAPEYPMNLKSVSFNIQSNDGAGTGGDGSFYVYLADYFGNMTDPFLVTPTTDQLTKAAQNGGWFDVDLTDKDIALQAEFFVGIGYDGINTPALGIDNTPNGSGYQWQASTNQWAPLDATVFIRAEVTYLDASTLIDVTIADTHAGGPGDLINVPVQITNVPIAGIDTVEIEISYDTDVLKLIDVSRINSLSSDWQIQIMDSLRTGRIIMKMAGGSPIISDGILFDLQFRIQPNAPMGQSSDLNIDVISLNNGNLPATPHHGRCRVFLGTPVEISVESPQSKGNAFWLDVDVGNAQVAAEDVFGLSFTLNYTQTGYVDVITPHAANALPGSFLGDDVVFFQTVDDGEGKISVAVTRKSGQDPVDGYGTAFRVQFVSDANTPNDTPVEFTLTDVKLTDETGTEHKTILTNQTVTITNHVNTPSFSPEPGSFTDPLDVTIECTTTGATIHYTTNGSTPTETSPMYTAPIHVENTTEIKARAFKAGLNPSIIASGQYTYQATGLTDSDSQMPDEFRLYPAYPNPFNPSTHISYTIPYSAGYVPVRLVVYNMLGKQIRQLVNDDRGPGIHSVAWDGRDQVGRDVSGGLYFYRLTAGSFDQVGKMLLIR